MIVLYRSGTAADVNFVLSSWLQSCRNRPFFTAWSNDQYFAEPDGYQGAVKALLRRDDTRTTVACSDEDHGQILGYAVTGDGVIHYVYVKQPFRKRGIARGLIAHALPRAGREVCAECGAVGRIGPTGPIVTRANDGALVQQVACGECGETYASRSDTVPMTTCTMQTYGWRELAERFRLVFNPWG